MPQTGKHIKLKIGEPKLLKLDNGLKVYVIEDNTIEFSRMDFVFSAGTSFQTKSLVAESTLNLLSEGTTTITSVDIANKLDYLGSIFDSNITKDKASITVYLLNKFIPEILPLIGDLIQNPIFPEEEISNYLTRKKNQFETNYQKVKYRSMLEFTKLVFGANSPYGGIKKVEDFNNVSRDDIISYYSSYYNIKNGYIVLSGKITNTTIELLNKYIGTITLSESTTRKLDFGVNAFGSETYDYIKIKDSLQSAIRIGKPIISKHHQDYNSLVVLNTVLGGFFGSRLMSNIREDKGFTYGINSFIINYLNSSYWCIATEVNAKNTNAAIVEIKSELQRLKNELISHEELNLVKNYIYGTYLRSFDGPIAQTDRFRAANDLNLDYSYYLNSLESMLSQTPETLIKTANRHLNFNSMIKLVVGQLENDKF